MLFQLDKGIGEVLDSVARKLPDVNSYQLPLLLLTALPLLIWHWKLYWLPEVVDLLNVLLMTLLYFVCAKVAAKPCNINKTVIGIRMHGIGIGSFGLSSLAARHRTSACAPP